jgi:hypothetical protein
VDTTLAPPFAYVRFEVGLEILEHFEDCDLCFAPFPHPSLIGLSPLRSCASPVQVSTNIEPLSPNPAHSLPLADPIFSQLIGVLGFYFRRTGLFWLADRRALARHGGAHRAP